MKSSIFMAAAAMLCGFFVAPVALAEDSAGSGFSFRRVAPPAPGEKRINVQIAVGTPVVYPAPDPSELPAPRPQSTLAGLPADEAAGALPFGWYWDAVSPLADRGGPGRFADAVAYLSQAPADAPVRTLRLDGLAGIAAAHGVDILKATIGTKVSPALALAVIAVESAGQDAAVSSAGAQGLMQLMPATAKRFGVTDSFDSSQNIKGGIAYLDWLLGEFGGDALLALAGYNAGENAVKRHGGVPPYSETRAYVPKVLAAWQVARGLCLTPPELPSDGCVFSVPGRQGG